MANNGFWRAFHFHFLCYLFIYLSVLIHLFGIITFFSILKLFFERKKKEEENFTVSIHICLFEQRSSVPQGMAMDWRSAQSSPSLSVVKKILRLEIPVDKYPNVSKPLLLLLFWAPFSSESRSGRPCGGSSSSTLSAAFWGPGGIL